MKTKQDNTTESIGKLRILTADCHSVIPGDAMQNASSDSRTARPDAQTAGANVQTVCSGVQTPGSNTKAESARADMQKESARADMQKESARSLVQAESVLSRKLTAAALEIYLRRTPSAEELAGELRNPGEKPCFPAFPDFHYNISHSCGIVVCGISDQPIGIDLQKIPTDPLTALRIAKRFFSLEEQESLLTLDDDDAWEALRVPDSDNEQPALHASDSDNKQPSQHSAIKSSNAEALCRLFCRFWTARESYIKLIGRGLAEPFSNFRPDLEAGVIRILNTEENEPVDKNEPRVRPLVHNDTFYLTEYPAPEGFCLTVCSTVPLPSSTPECPRSFS